MEDNTRRSLLVRVRDASDSAAWTEFEQRYRELIVRFARGRGLQPADADDLCQAVMLKLSRVLRDFEHDGRQGRFRGFLHRVVRNQIIDQFVRPSRGQRDVDLSSAAALADDADDASETAWQREWENHHFRLAMRSVRESFDPESVAVFERLLQGESVVSTAASFKLSEQAVHKIKQRIRTRMRALIERQVAEEDDPDGFGRGGPTAASDQRDD